MFNLIDCFLKTACFFVFSALFWQVTVDIRSDSIAADQLDCSMRCLRLGIIKAKQPNLGFFNLFCESDAMLFKKFAVAAAVL